MKRSQRSPALLAALLLPALLAGCGGDKSTEANGGDPISFPIAIGTTWVYSVTTSSTDLAAESDTTRIIGTETVDGKTWYVFVDHSSGDTTLARQEGQSFYVFPSSEDGGTGGDENPFVAYLGRVLENSLPWKYADFGAAAGASWTLVEAETTFALDIGGVPYEASVEVSFRCASGGRTTVSVPAGTYADAYRGEIAQRIVFTTPAGADTVTSESSYWIADGVGVVKRDEVNSDPFEGVTETRTEALESYDLR
ncbi:MAG: hypothetical protein ABIH26_06955 [Candidatus Eisenbacteria bacterium]